MEDRRSDIKFGSSSCRGSGEASATAGGVGKGKKSRTPSLVLGNDEREASAATDIRSTWTGEKKIKIQDTPTSGGTGKVAMTMDDDSADKIVEEQEQGPDQIEGLDWDQDKLNEKIKCYLQQLKCDLPDNEDFWVHCDDIQRRELNERLALYRIRAYKEEHRKMTDANLKAIYPANFLEDEGYCELYELDFEWYFDPQYCDYARLQDYQRLMLRNNGEYEDWEEYRNACSTLESDQAFVQLWEKLLSNTKLMEFILTNRSYEPLKRESVAFYHALKIAAELSCIYKPLIHFGFTEFIFTVRFDHSWDKYYAGFFGELWKRVAKQKMNFKEALKEVYYEGKYTRGNFEWKYEFESSNPGPLEHLYNTHLNHIDEKAEEGVAYQLIMEAAKKIFPKRKTYYDYAKKKLGIAKEIGLIPLDPCESST
ncbi:unnamed protein product [Urochloa decumbens]|uniref:Uncharacterized protein n=1 Tax=Urochloa decumbens TaxID=240449 RepID=A0ABC8XKV9_9POAL